MTEIEPGRGGLQARAARWPGGFLVAVRGCPPRLPVQVSFRPAAAGLGPAGPGPAGPGSAGSGPAGGAAAGSGPAGAVRASELTSTDGHGRAQWTFDWDLDGSGLAGVIRTEDGWELCPVLPVARDPAADLPLRRAWRNVATEWHTLRAGLRRLLGDSGDLAALVLAETVRHAAAEAFRSGRRAGPDAAEVAVVQDRIDGRPGLVVLHRESGEPFPRIVDEIMVDLPTMSERDSRRWPVASSPRARVWRFRPDDVADRSGAAGSGLRP